MAHFYLLLVSFKLGNEILTWIHAIGTSFGSTVTVLLFS